MSNGIFSIPFVIAVDDRESAPWSFTGLRADADRGYQPLYPRLQRAHLDTGDYSIIGLESRITIERKSAEDLFSTLASGRERFQAEHIRMRNMIHAGGFAAVVIESSLESCLLNPPLWSRLPPKVVMRTYMSWLVRYGVPWVFTADRRLAEVTAFRLLQKYWDHFGKDEIADRNQKEPENREIKHGDAQVA